MAYQSVKQLLLLLSLVSLAACSEQPVDQNASSSGPLAVNNGALQSSGSERWYAADQAETGREVFSQNCAVCHGDQAQGTVADWREKLDDGSFPPPPLNGSAHAWHHPQEILLRVIDYGGESMGGKMPAFIDSLDQSEKLAAIAYFQSFWSNEIYEQWVKMGGTD